MLMLYTCTNPLSKVTSPFRNHLAAGRDAGATTMSLLPDDELSTLEAALAFIDTYHGKGDSLASPGGAAATSTSGSDSANDDGESAGKRGSPPAVAVERKARNAQASARSHRKKRAELLLLREEEGALQTQLAALKARKAERQRRGEQPDALSEWTAIDAGRSSTFGAAVAVSSAHYDHALHQRRVRQKAEALNRQLRAALRKQRSLTDQFSQLIQKRLMVKVRFAAAWCRRALRHPLPV